MRALKLLSWNVNGIRAIERKGELGILEKGEHDVIALQEIKVHDPATLSEFLQHPKGYTAYWDPATERKGYSGVVTYSKIPPKSHTINFGDNLLSKEGRMIELDFGEFVLLNVYFPNGGQGPTRLQYKLIFYDQFLDYVKKLTKKGRKVIFTGDVNTAHKEIDLARPKENSERTGFLPIERKWIDRIIESGFTDAFRMFHSEAGQYTYWDMKTFARDRNVGWRIDYFFVSKNFLDAVKDCYHLPDIWGSDHCPIVLEISF